MTRASLPKAAGIVAFSTIVNKDLALFGKHCWRQFLALSMHLSMRQVGIFTISGKLMFEGGDIWKIFGSLLLYLHVIAQST